MIFFNKTKFNSTLFITASLSAFFVLGFLYFALFANALFQDMARQNSNNVVNQAEEETCVQESDFDMSDPYVTKAPEWNKEK
ncbi:MAG: hypothetical protein US83_C0005G0090 [Candidatus Falkowbacteria bacterium GW2011_GWC2_38_22]|uniref:Uncharacterized protein n=1 Tax=Candidatus Falkowbacteria bacterium GW2011_GWE1_38_31 TaxID=1618638 RepID=A0A0G0M9F4_9BACT|nr:MAG: hypothetical protein US73_C0003G0004 [Candidatus Falkowbacteria bacterium GW2011_GWF2_38_1205]KKQ61577.1 MAG: hypothetical protein US83_C0005G0090 [Candidatus Falkowbacteria bacterium GW2011_GWC2_38_22]KKQ63530.1 MAG: hypothetical protein US84_C0005G0004 [Candidatus Falkowbacteria bacterium GW2011_GWF1_38_22]KKQ65682.1 MAG: hypothetical protein US87_C0005G0004 [Candidatus Falkowbacteria bacterium GW2011_GWE2_38_254]KKQ70299.1 MAG: hypothetical protein US91_C0005G0004 [Candidatus Falkowb